jgi:hypothetical protein
MGFDDYNYRLINHLVFGVLKQTTTGGKRASLKSKPMRSLSSRNEKDLPVPEATKGGIDKGAKKGK